MAKKSATSKGYRKQASKKPFLSKKEIVILCVIAAAVLIGFIVLLNYDDGALKLADGALVTEGDNWLIVNGTYGRNNARYFKVGEAGEIEGYTRAAQASQNSVYTFQYVYTPEVENGVNSIGIDVYPAVTAQSLAEYYAALLPSLSGMEYEVSEVQTGEAGGVPYVWFSWNAQPIPEDAEASDDTGSTDAAEPADATEAAATDCSRGIQAGIDTAHSGALRVAIDSSGATLEDCLSEDALREELAKAIAAISLEAK